MENKVINKQKMANCLKCGVELKASNTLHRAGGQVNWCDACWKKYWQGRDASRVEVIAEEE